MPVTTSSPSDPPVGQRQHRQDEHRGLPVATSKRDGYLSAGDKQLLDALRAAGVTAAATTPTTPAVSTAALDAAIQGVKAMLPSGATKDLNTYLKADGSQALTGDMAVNAGKKIDGLDLSAHNHSDLGGGPVDHGYLNGIGDDDHTQYYNQPRGDARYSLTTHLHSGTYALVQYGIANGNNHDHSGGDGAQIDHGGLAGLADDDHLQYLKTDGSRALTANLSTATSGVLIDSVKLHAHRHSGNTGIGDGVQVYHDDLLNLGNDDHAQYHTDARGDARYSVLAHAHAYGALTGLPFLPQRAVTTTQFDKVATNGLSAITGLAVNITAPGTYMFEAVLFFTASAAGGSRFSVGINTSTVGSILYQIQMWDDVTAALSINARQTASNGASGQAGVLNGMCIIRGTFAVTGTLAGNVGPRFAQSVASGTSSVLAGSSFTVSQVA
ncbi:MAG: hypothetical protein ACYC63_16900 [Armatimonadota bacterium]